jgi:coenzyme F420-reducing hydrogenase delta subunit
MIAKTRRATALCAIVTTGIIAHLYNTDDRFWMGSRLDVSFVLGTISWGLDVLLVVGIVTGGLTYRRRPRDGYQPISDH